MQTRDSVKVTKGLFSKLAGVSKPLSNRQKVEQMADMVEEAIEQVGLLAGKADYQGAHDRLETAEDVMLDALEVAEAVSGKSMPETRASVREAKRQSDAIQKLIDDNQVSEAKKLILRYKARIDDALAPLRRVALYLKD